MPIIKRHRPRVRLPEDHPTFYAFVAAMLYVVVAGTYILVSGRIAAMFARSMEQLRTIEAFKGIVFVLVTGLLFFLLSLGLWRKTRRQRELLLQSERKAVAAMYSATLAHDLNNLLLGLSCLVEAFQGHEKDDSSLAQLRSSVEHSIQRLAPFAKRIASSARNLSSGETVELDLPTALEQTAELARKHPDVRLCDLHIESATPLQLSLDQALLEQALLNLIVNAAQAAGPHGKITLAVTRRDRTVSLDVHDSGPGIPPEKTQSIFNPGYTTKTSGSGLGLLTVQAFAASCRARISVERSPLGGALFRITIPLNSETAETPAI